jgi:phosphoribosyl 1,2-cyclic phosphodiesterase
VRLLSHFHWDHIQRLPFFVPAYVPSTKLAIYGGASGKAEAAPSLKIGRNAIARILKPD